MDTIVISRTGLTQLVLEFRDTTGLPLARLAKLAGLSTGTVSNVANAKPGQRFDPETEAAIRRAIARYVIDVSAFAGVDDDPDLDQAIDRINRRR